MNARAWQVLTAALTLAALVAGLLGLRPSATLLIAAALACACLAIVFGRKDALRLLRERDRLAAQIAGGALPHPASGFFSPLVNAAGTALLDSQRSAGQALVLLDSLQAAMLVLDHELRVVFRNRAAEEVLGFGSPISRGQRPVALYRLPLLVTWIERVFAGDDHQSARLALPDGRMLQIEVTRFQETDGSALVLAHDVSSTVRLENTRRDFVAAVSHELRTPLTSIRGYAEALLEEKDMSRETAERFLGTIVSNCARLTRLAEDLVTLSSIETGHYPFHFEALDVRTLVQPALDVLSPIAAAHHSRLSPGVIEDAALYADREALHRVLLNLIENALLHGGEGLHVQVSGKIVDDRYHLSIRDTGHGIPLEDQPRIFERFYRVDRSRSRQRGGSGLGLALVKHLVQEHGGSIDVQSAVGRGSTFTLRLPLAAEVAARGISYAAHDVHHD